MIFGVRHGERADMVPLKHPERKAIEIKFDPQLTLKGVKQAEQTGLFLQTKIDEYAKAVGTPIDEMQAIVISSPFLRTIQTAYAIAKGLRKVYSKTIYLQEEICEYLAKTSYDSNPMDLLFCKTNQHKIENYIDKTSFELQWNLVKPTFRPKYPENSETSLQRTIKGMQLIKDQYFGEFDTNKFVLIYVTHRDTLQMSVSSFGKDYTNENCLFCSILQVFFEGNQQERKNNPKILMEATSDHVRDLL